MPQRVPHVSNLGDARIGQPTYSTTEPYYTIEDTEEDTRPQTFKANQVRFQPHRPPNQETPPRRSSRNIPHQRSFSITPYTPLQSSNSPDERMSALRYHRSRGSPYTTRTNSGTNSQGHEYSAKSYSDGTRSYQYRNRDGGVYDRHRDGSAEYYAPSGSVRHYHPQYYSDEDRSDGGYYSSESPEDTDSERDDYRDRGHRHGHYIPDDLGAAHVPDSESSSEGGVPGSESETETDEYSDRYAPEEYESESAYDRDDRDSYGDPYGDWDEYDDDDYGEYDDGDSSDYYY